MKSSSKPFDHKLHNYGQRERCANLLIKGLPFVLISLLIATILSFFLLYSPNLLNLVPNQSNEIIENHSQNQEHEHAKTFVPNQDHGIIENHSQNEENQHANISTTPSPSKPHYKGTFQNEHIHIQSLYMLV